MSLPITITINTFLELAVLRAILSLASRYYHSSFDSQVAYELFKITNIDQQRIIPKNDISTILDKLDKQVGR